MAILTKGRVLIFSLTVAAAAILFAGCRERGNDAAGTHEHGTGPAIAGSEKAEGEQLYQCSMHPNIVSEKPGKCPICAMDLQPVKKIDAKGIPGRAPVELTEQQQQLINIRLAPIIKREAEKTLRTVGVVTYDQTSVADVNARIMGWVEALYVDKPGQPVTNGQPLMALYSPELYSAQQEYLLALRNAQSRQTNKTAVSEQLREFNQANRSHSENLARSARKRLELWGISPKQIEALESSGNVSNTMVLSSPISGVVVEKNVFPQQMIQPGMRLYRIADISKVWIEPEIYEYEVPFVQAGQNAIVQVPAYPGTIFNGKVDFIYPYVDPKTRTVRIRLVFENPENRLKPGMYANATIESALGKQLLVPASAVFDTGRRSYVFVEKEAGVYVPKLIELGAKVEGYHVVLSGLEPGEKVVVDGNFLMDSESQLKAAAVGSFETDEASDLLTTTEHGKEPIPLPETASPFISGILTNYLAIGNALVKDQFQNLQPVLTNLSAKVAALIESKIVPGKHASEFTNQVAQLAREVGEFDVSSLESARVHYGEVSQALITLMAHFRAPLKETLYIAECPMWKKSPPRWLQSGQELENPFMGQKMLQCGEIILTIEPLAKPVAMASEAAPIIEQILGAYQKIYEPLAQDKLEGVAEAAASLNEHVKQLRDRALVAEGSWADFERQLDILTECIAAFEPGGDLELARKHFGEVSSALIELFQRYPPPLDQSWTVFHCPMWTKSRSLWIQKSAEARNPFMGQKMLSCGEVVNVLG